VFAFLRAHDLSKSKQAAEQGIAKRRLYAAGGKRMIRALMQVTPILV